MAVDRLFRPGSVTDRDIQSAETGIFWFVIPSYGGVYLVNNLPPEPPVYAPNNKERDAILSITPHVEGLWADAVKIATSRIVTKGYNFDGPSYLIDRLQEMFDTCDNRNGFFHFLSRHLRDYYTTDNGAWVEIERTADSPGAEIVSFHHLDSLRCWRTGDPQTPLYYQDILGGYHKLNWYQCFNVVDMSNPRAGYFNSGFSAASRAYRHIRKLAALDTYFDEKITGQGHTAIEFIQGVTPKQLKQAAETTESEDRDKGIIYYHGKLLVPILSDQVAQVVSVPLKDVPDGFQREEEFRISALNYAKAIGLPPHDLDPSLVARGALGVGTQTVVIEENIAGYGEGAWEKQFVKAMNRLIMPDRVTFSFETKDVRDEQARAQVASTRAAERATRIGSGEITVQQAQQLAMDAGDLPRELAQMSDVTPQEQLSDEEKPEEVAGVEALVGHDPETAVSDLLAQRKSITYSRFKQRGSTSAMIAFILDESDSAALLSSLPSDIKPSEDLHITLIYLGKITELGNDRDMILPAIGEFADRSQQPITGTVQGVGRFLNDEGDGTNALYASFDSPELSSFRESLAKMLQSAGIEIEFTHGFTPHITLAYIPKDAPMPDVDIPVLKMTFDTLTLAWGDELFNYRLFESAQKSAPADYAEAMRLLAAEIRKARKALKDFDPRQPRDESGKWEETGANGNGDEMKHKPGSFSSLPESERTHQEERAINSSEYLTVIKKGKFTGYHWTDPETANRIDEDGIKGSPFNERLGFTLRDIGNLRKDGAIFAFVDDDPELGADWGKDAVLYKVTGSGYLVNHSQEGKQIVFRADQVNYERVS